jgi:SAM-dependent methyltransferase
MTRESPFDFDSQAEAWERDRPISLSDLVARASAFEILDVLCADKDVIDLGCGEGFMSRRLAPIARSVMGVDISPGMIRLAELAERREPLGIKYFVGDVRGIRFLQPNSGDVAVATFVTNYLGPEELHVFYGEVSRLLRSFGSFVVTMPHPVLFLREWIEMNPSPENPDFDYHESRGKWFSGTLKNIAGRSLEAKVRHTSIEDHFLGLSEAGLLVTRVVEPVVPQSLCATYPVFAGAEGKVQYMILVGHKP